MSEVAEPFSSSKFIWRIVQHVLHLLLAREEGSTGLVKGLLTRLRLLIRVGGDNVVRRGRVDTAVRIRVLL